MAQDFAYILFRGNNIKEYLITHSLLVLIISYVYVALNPLTTYAHAMVLCNIVLG